MSKNDDATKYIREIIELTREDGDDYPDFTRKGEPFLSKANLDIFKAHPDSVKGILFNPNYDYDQEYVKKIKKRK